MSVVGSNILAGASGAGGAPAADYQIERSLRFNSSDSAYLGATFGTPTDQDVFTLSMWVKRSALGSTQQLFGVSTNHSFGFTSGDALNLTFGGSSALTTTALFRDPAAWYHVVWKQNGTAHELYVNNVSVGTATATSDTFNTGVAHQIGAANTTNYLNGYLADVHFIDGQALDSTSFGEFDDNGIWQPIAYTGTYPGNSFHLDFSDNSSAAALGTDTSGAGNNWTVNNISVAAGAGNDSLVDSPTNYGIDTGVGGEVRGNYCTWNPLDNGGNTLSNGNLDITGVGATIRITRSTFALPTSGKWYAECELKTAPINGFPNFGIVSGSQALTGAYTGTTLQIRPKGADSNRPYWVIDTDDASKRVNTTPLDSGSIIQLIYDADLGKVWMGMNNIYYGLSSGSTVTVSASDITNGTNPAYTLSSAITYFTCLAAYSSVAVSINFGQRPFAYTAPSGFKALCTANLPDPTIADGLTAMDVALYTGNGTSQTISGLGFSPDLIWFKSRSASRSHGLFDSVRGRSKSLFSDLTTAELTSTSTQDLVSFDANGFTVGTVNNSGSTNANNDSIVAWTWDAGTSTVSNTDGSITSSVRANPSAGFSIVSYTGNQTNGATVGHGLNATPSLLIGKNRDASEGWLVAFKDSSNTWLAGVLNVTEQFYDLLTSTSYRAQAWNNTPPTSSVFELGDDNGNWTNVLNNNQDYVVYCFAPVDGYSSFGSYTGNGSTDGRFVFTNHRPRWILLKRTDTTSNWTIIDTAREGYNVDNDPLYANLPNLEGTTDLADILSNGFKLRSADASVNANAGTYIFASFAEKPFKTARAR